MSEDRMPQVEAAQIARQRKAHEERLHQWIFSTPYGMDALANHLALKGKVTWSAQIRQRAERTRDCLEKFILHNNETVFLGIAIHKDMTMDTLRKAKKNEQARRDLANLLLDLPGRFSEIASAHPDTILLFPEVLPPRTGIYNIGYDAQMGRFHSIYGGFFSQGVALLEPIKREINGEAKRLQQGHLYMVDDFTARFPREERREALSDAGRGLALASHKYDPDLGGIDFEEYAKWCIRDAYMERTGSRSIQTSDRTQKILTRSQTDEPLLAPEYLLSLRKRKILSFKQIEVLRLRFGLAGEGEHSLEEVAKIYKTIPSEIGEQEARAFAAIRRTVLEDFPDETRRYQKEFRDSA